MPLSGNRARISVISAHATHQRLFPTLTVRVCATVKRSLPLHACLCFQAKRWEEFPNLTFTFDCSDRAVGFYADTEHHCQIFHMCDEDGRRIPYICANDTSFNQEFRVCDWEYNFDCNQAPQWSVIQRGHSIRYSNPYPQKTR